MKVFINSQFYYCPLVWMFPAQTLKIISKIHERVLRLVYDDSPYLSFDELLINKKSAGIHQIDLQFLATEIFKVKNGVSTGFTEHIFQVVNKTYDLRNNKLLLRKRNRTFFNVTESLSFLALKFSELVPQSLKDKTVLNSKLKSKHGLPVNAHSDCVKNILFKLVSFRLFLCIDFNILFNACVLHLLWDGLNMLLQYFIQFFVYYLFLYDCNLILFFSI